MSEKVYVKPAAGRLVRNELTLEPIPAEGAYVRKTRLMMRRLNDGDLELAEPPAAEPSSDTATRARGSRRGNESEG